MISERENPARIRYVSKAISNNDDLTFNRRKTCSLSGDRNTRTIAGIDRGERIPAPVPIRRIRLRGGTEIIRIWLRLA